MSSFPGDDRANTLDEILRTIESTPGVSEQEKQTVRAGFAVVRRMTTNG